MCLPRFGSFSMCETKMPSDGDLQNRVGTLLFNGESSDVTLIVGGESLPAHRAILASSSDYFRALLRGNTEESLQNEIIMKDTPLEGFKLVMTYIYTGRFEPDHIEDSTLLELLELSNLYGLQNLSTRVCEKLRSTLSPQNVFFEKVRMLQLKEVCCRVLEASPEEVLESDRFCKLPSAAVCQIISRDTFGAAEIKIYKAVERWDEANRNHPGLPEVLEAIRLPLIGASDLLSIYKTSSLFEYRTILEAMQPVPGSLHFRGALLKEENLATRERRARIITGEANDGGFREWTTFKTYSCRAMPSYPSEVKFVPEAGLTVALRKPFIVNPIEFQLPNRDIGSYTYSVEVSMNLKHWDRVMGSLANACRSLRLYFERRVVRYVRIIGFENGEDRRLACLSRLVVSYADTPGPTSRLLESASSEHAADEPQE